MDATLLRAILRWIWETHAKPWEYKSLSLRVYERIGGGYPSFSNEKELENVLPTQTRLVTDFSRSGKFLYLNPTRRGTPLVPVLSMSCDLGRAIPKIQFRLGLFLLDNDEIKAVGMRYEAPETSEGVHHFYHMQFINYFYGSKVMQGCPDWTPDTQPSLPIDATDPVQLTLCLLASLYGLEAFAELQLASFKNELAQYIRRLKVMDPSFQPRYWSAERLKPGYYKTFHDDERAKTLLKSKGGKSLKQITREVYEDQSERSRGILE